ncbi:MAG: ABC transporter ATP-binding protein, partial [Gammaproteobacteria bacterium]|nr:ABC transporter ATP-binding protein [Gammaproteobacteria bacterium]
SKLYERTAAVAELIELCALSEFLDRDTRKLSGGQRQRLLLAVALINDPQLVFLDEPTTGLDPQARRNFWDLVSLVKSRGKTVVLTTHYMEEAYALCDEIVIMDKGKIMAQGTPVQLLTEHFGDVVIQLPKVDVGTRLAGTSLQGVEGGDFIEIHTHDLHNTLTTLIAAGVSLAQLRIRAWTLEDLFIALTGKGLRA